MDGGGNIWQKKDAASKLGSGPKRVAAAYIFGILACIVAGSFDERDGCEMKRGFPGRSFEVLSLLLHNWHYCFVLRSTAHSGLHQKSLHADTPSLVAFGSLSTHCSTGYLGPGALRSCSITDDSDLIAVGGS